MINYKTYAVAAVSIVALLSIVLYFVIQKANNIIELRNQAIRAHKDGDCDNSIIFADQYLQITDQSPFPHQISSDCYYKKGLLRKALRHAELAISSIPKDQYLYYLRGRVLLEMGDSARGCWDITQTIKVKGNLLTSSDYPIDYMDTLRFMDIDYRYLLALRIKYCDQIMPGQVKVDKEIMENVTKDTL